MSTILDKIVDQKKKRIAEAKEKCSIYELMGKINDLVPIKSFSEAIIGKEKVSIIGEIKKASPSKGKLREDFDPCSIAEIYNKDGISAISVLTEEDFFEGNLHHLSSVKYISDIPVLRKDFIIDVYQIIESRVYRADAVLLICRILENQQLKELLTEASNFGLECLVEVHNNDEIDRALMAGAKIIGINNRNLEDFSINIDNTFKLISSIPSSIPIVTESGFCNAEDLLKIKNKGIDAVLIGEAFMTSENLEDTIKEFIDNT